MMILLISCLLIGSITCNPAWKEQGSGAQDPAATGHMAQTYPASWGSGGSSSLSNPGYGVSSAGHGVHLGGYDGSGGSYGAGVYANSGAGGYGSAGAYDGSGGSYGAGYDAGSYGGAGYGATSTSNTGAGTQSSGPIFSDVSDLDPVYGFSYRSRYQRGRAVFAQSRYRPGEPLVAPMPIYKPVIKNPVLLRIPAQEPVQEQKQGKQPQQQAVPIRYQTKGGR